MQPMEMTLFYSEIESLGYNLMNAAQSRYYVLLSGTHYNQEPNNSQEDPSGHIEGQRVEPL